VRLQNVKVFGSLEVKPLTRSLGRPKGHMTVVVTSRLVE